MISASLVIAFVIVAALMVLLVWTSIRVPDPKHAMMLDLTSLLAEESKDADKHIDARADSRAKTA